MADAYVSAYFDNDEERKAAMQVLRDPVEYEGVIEGYANEAAIAELTKRQLVVTIQSEEEAPYETPLQTRSKYNDTDLQDRLLELKQRAQVVPPPEVLESLGPDDAMAAPAPPPPQAYKVTLAGPIRPDWRDALQNLGAEISDYSRGTYRVYLDPFSIDALRALPFVKSAEEDTVNDAVSSSVLLSIAKEKKKRGGRRCARGRRRRAARDVRRDRASRSRSAACRRLHQVAQRRGVRRAIVERRSLPRGRRLCRRRDRREHARSEANGEHAAAGAVRRSREGDRGPRAG